MNTTPLACAAVAASALFLTACGGGNNDDPTPSDQPGVLTVSGAQAAGVNGIYGDGALNLTDVDKKNPVGSDPEVCTFRFDGANKVGGGGTAFGDIRYRPNADTIHVVYLNISGREYASGEAADSLVDRERDRVRLANKRFTATDGSGDEARVSGIVPMRAGRPSGC